jgi:hypothetical protein
MQIASHKIWLPRYTDLKEMSRRQTIVFANMLLQLFDDVVENIYFEAPPAECASISPQTRK